MNLAAMVEPHPDGAVALVEGDREVTYGELRRQLSLLRGALVARGVRPGDRVAVIGPNGIGLVEAFLAVLGVGAIVVPLNPQSPPLELQREREAVGVTEVLTTSAGEIDDLVQSGQPPAPLVAVDDDAVAVLCFTSGTAGAPRAAMLTHRSLRANVDQMASGPDHLRPDDVVLGVLPLFHVYGFGVALDATLTAGARLVLTPRFEPESTRELVARQRVTILPGAPPMWVAWAQPAQLDGAAREGFVSVRQALSGAAKLPEDVAAILDDRLGLVVREGYGLTEASPVVTTSVGIEPRRGSVGKALDGVEVRVVDEDGGDVLDGDPGEIWVRGPNVFAGYWEDPEATARVLSPDGWLRTGDVAVVEDGYLYIVDRAKDLIIVSGFNVFPAEVEQVIAEAPGVAEVCVVGVPHETTGEAVRAYVVPTPGGGERVTEEAVVAWCRLRLARYKCPTSVLVVDALPKGLGGKVLRRALR
jgi:long-chain acyl-CoA synthetase